MRTDAVNMLHSLHCNRHQIGPPWSKHVAVVMLVTKMP